LRLASVLQKGLFNEELIDVKKTKVAGHMNILSDMLLPSDLLANTATLKNTEYRCNMLLVLEVFSQDKILVGWLKKVVIRRKAVFFLVTTKACYRQDLEYFESVRGSSKQALVGWDELKSFKPLLPRGTEDSFVFFLHGKLTDNV
jgi:hypothetical protein